ncbi:unnamed protein product, partial [marine sediment metagenome]
RRQSPKWTQLKRIVVVNTGGFKMQFNIAVLPGDGVGPEVTG